MLFTFILRRCRVIHSWRTPGKMKKKKSLDFGVEGLEIAALVLEAEIHVSLVAVKVDVNVAATIVATVALFAFALLLTAAVDQAPNKTVFAKKAGQNVAKNALILFLLLALAAALSLGAVADVDGPAYGHSRHTG